MEQRCTFTTLYFYSTCFYSSNSLLCCCQYLSVSYSMCAWLQSHIIIAIKTKFLERPFFM